MENIEVQTKFMVRDPAAVKARLRERGAEPDEPIHRVDTYFNSPHRDFLAPEAISEFLRIRTQAGETSINYQRWLPVDEVDKTHADEYESGIADVEAIRRILQMLDFIPLVTVDVTRERWRLGEVEIAFDHVVNAGDFVEFGFRGEAATAAEATARLDEFIADLGIQLGEQDDRGYPQILLGRQH